MNSIGHFFINYVIIDLFFGSASEFIIPIAVFSAILDLDHLPYLIRNWKRIMKKGFGVDCRSFLHEVPGMVFLGVIWLLLFFITGNSALLVITYSCLFLHFLFDILIGDSRPFYPLSDIRVISPLGLKGKKRILFEIIGTLLAGLAFLVVLLKA